MKVLFTPEVSARVDALVQATDDEVAWFGLGDPVWNKSGERVVAVRVDEIYVPTQEVSATTVNASSFNYKYKNGVYTPTNEDFSRLNRFEAFDYWQEQYGDEFLSRLCHFGHSHVNMGTEPSSVDTDFWSEWINGVPNGYAQWLAATIHNKKGEVYAELRVNAPGVGGIVFDAEFDVERTTNEYHEWAKQQIADKCKRSASVVKHPSSTKTYTPQKYDGSAMDYSLSEYNQEMLGEIFNFMDEIRAKTKLTENQFKDAFYKLKAYCEKKGIWVTEAATELRNTAYKNRTCDQDRFLEILDAWEDLMLDTPTMLEANDWDEGLGMYGGGYA